VSELPSRPPFRVNPDVARSSIAQTDGEVQASLAARPWQPAALRGPMLLALDNAAMRASVDPGDRAIGGDLERVACIGAALFGGLAAGAGTQIAAPLPGGGVVAVAGAAPQRNIGEPAYWREALLAALAVRQTRAVSMLAGVPIAVLRGLAPELPDWRFHEYEALQALALRNADAATKLVAAARAADPDTVDEASRDFVLDVIAPELQLGFRALDRDQAGFETWMTIAIERHHHYFQSHDARKRQPLSQLALAPLAMASVAHEMGMRTHVTTEYLPRHIIEG
jgi:hypothetical protein